jgi:hypothetical protein
MSTIRKVSLDYRNARLDARRKRAEAAAAAQMARFQDALRLGMIKPPTPKLPTSARMVLPREDLKARCPNAITVANGRRSGGTKPYELQTYARPPDRNKYAGHFSPGSWK